MKQNYKKVIFAKDALLSALWTVDALSAICVYK